MDTDVIKVNQLQNTSPSANTMMSLMGTNGNVNEYTNESFGQL